MKLWQVFIEIKWSLAPFRSDQSCNHCPAAGAPSKPNDEHNEYIGLTQFSLTGDNISLEAKVSDQIDKMTQLFLKEDSIGSKDMISESTKMAEESKQPPLMLHTIPINPVSEWASKGEEPAHILGKDGLGMVLSTPINISKPPPPSPCGPQWCQHHECGFHDVAQF